MENSVENMHPDFRAERVNLAVDWHPTQWELKAEYVKIPRNNSFTCNRLASHPMGVEGRVREN